MKGQTAYRFQLAMQGGQSEVSFASNLQGMALDLPAPLRKEADAACRCAGCRGAHRGGAR